jgi:glycosyltransferase involved in cell wall biosynthesis
MNQHLHTDHTLVSIIIPTYNSDKYIADAITSVIKQDYKNWELLVVDDGSTDNTTAVVSEFLSDPRITYFKKENSGVSHARNYGAERAKGRYLCFLDADDSFHSTNVSEKVAVLNNNPDAGLVHADISMTDARGNLLHFFNTGLSGSRLHLALLLWNECVIPAPSSIMVTKEAFYAVGKWDPLFSTAADQDFFIRVTAAYPIYRINRPLTSYRIVDASMSKNPAVFEKDHLAVYRKAKNNNLFPDMVFEKKCFSNLHLIIAGNWWMHGEKIKAIKHVCLSFLFSPVVFFKRLKLKLFSNTSQQLILQKK